MMKTWAAFFKLIRWPNLVFIIITQILFYRCVYIPLQDTAPAMHTLKLFGLLIIASVAISAAGYIINDYFDLQIDMINKPERLVIGKFIKRRYAIIWHWVLSGIGILISIYISYRTNIYLISIVNFLCVVLLWFYSTIFKKRLLSGNIIISALTAWVILVVYFFCGAAFFTMHGWEGSSVLHVRRFFKLTMLYTGFAFVISLIREVVKDLEDMDGDRKYGCRTMPIAWGVPASKIFSAVWICVCIAGLAALSLYAWLSGWWPASIYIVLFLVIPLAFILKKLYHASANADYHSISSAVKGVMLAGILTMLFFIFL